MQMTNHELAEKVRSFMYSHYSDFKLDDRCLLWDLLVRFENIEHFGASNLSVLYYDDQYISIDEIYSMCSSFKKLTNKDVIALPKETELLLEVEDSELEKIKKLFEEELERRKNNREDKINQSELPEQLVK